MLEPLIAGTKIKLYIVRSIRSDWRSELNSKEVAELSWKMRARHTDLDSSNKEDVDRLMSEIVEDLLRADEGTPLI